MRVRRIGPFEVSAIGLGCMNLSHAYGTPPDAQTGARLLNEALDLGYTHLDTAALYGFGANETLLGSTIKSRRGEYMLASKCGIFRNAQGVREIDGRPEVILQTCDASLKRLQTDVIDLYYLHRWDKRVPIEDSVGALAGLVQAGKVRTIGLSEVSADTIRKAHRVHPITAVQSEYSPWTRNPEIKVFDVCRELGIALVAFSPVGRGFFGGDVRDSAFGEKDIRRSMPRFQSGNLTANLWLLGELKSIAREQDCSTAQLALAWTLSRGEFITPIPGTTSLEHLEENRSAADLRVDEAVLDRVTALFAPARVHGARYSAATQAEIDTEEWVA
jgi:aryl-alcohol dehydrogenase-like predicted oxidoreductase